MAVLLDTTGRFFCPRQMRQACTSQTCELLPQLPAELNGIGRHVVGTRGHSKVDSSGGTQQRYC
ncbi:MAG: hypothetical protein WD648_06530 [Planctomycetaceae bacterium]